MNRFFPGMSPSHIIQSPKGLKTLEAQLDSVGVVNMDVFVSNNDSGGGVMESRSKDDLHTYI